MTLWLVMACTSAAGAQTITATSGAVNGTVTDSTKALLPGVTVRLSGPSILAGRTTLTGRPGPIALPPGDHTLTFELAGDAGGYLKKDKTWKGEYTSVVTDALYVEARVGSCHSASSRVRYCRFGGSGQTGAREHARAPAAA